MSGTIYIVHYVRECANAGSSLAVIEMTWGVTNILTSLVWGVNQSNQFEVPTYRAHDLFAACSDLLFGRHQIILGYVDNSSPRHRRPAACPRDPGILNKKLPCCLHSAPDGSRRRAAGRRQLNCQQTLDFHQIFFFYSQ